MRKINRDQIPDTIPPGLDAEALKLAAEAIQGARAVKSLYDGYLEAGFTDEQELRLVMASLQARS